MSERPRIYLAGPEVFLPDAADVGREKARICEAAGLEGVFPLDAALDLAALDKPEAARRISLANEALIRSCDALIANLTPFRGVSMDSGTAFEIGYMRALGRPVLGYTNVAADYPRRVEAHRGRPRADFDCDRDDHQIEDFGLAENLMIEIAILESGAVVERLDGDPARLMGDLTGFARCVERVRRMLTAPSGS